MENTIPCADQTVSFRSKYAVSPLFSKLSDCIIRHAVTFSTDDCLQVSSRFSLFLAQSQYKIRPTQALFTRLIDQKPTICYSVSPLFFLLFYLFTYFIYL